MTSPAQQALQKLMGLWTILFAGAGLFFAFCSPWVIEIFNQMTTTWQLPFVTIASEPNHMWLGLSLSLMATITYMTWQCWKKPENLIVFTPPLLLSKLVSTVSFFIFFWTHAKALAYLAGSFVDGAIFVITWIFYRRAFSK